MFNFAISAWRAWAPGISDAPAWQAWARAPYCPTVPCTAPDLGFLPPLQRRRLSPMARMAVACAWPLADAPSPMPVVYASHHGETTRGYDLLHCLARDEALSPTSFSLSVHNATAGMWSILRKETVESVALSVAGDGLESAIAEACLLLAAGHPHALVVLAEEAPPAAYRPWIDDIPFPYALALRVDAGARAPAPADADGDAPPPGAFQLRARAPAGVAAPAATAAAGPAAGDPAAADPSADDPGWPHPLSLLRHLLLGTAAWRHPGRNRDWQWQRAS
jgi:hypothetical protein